MQKSDNMILIKELVSEWLQGLVFAAFEYSAGFSVRFEQQSTVTRHTTGRFPEVAILDLKGEWWIDERVAWQKLVNTLSQTTGVHLLQEPAQAYCLMLLVGHTIKEVKLSDKSELILVIDTGQTLHVSGHSDIWEESWIIYPPADLPDNHLWSITCDSQGEGLAIWDSKTTT